MRSCPLVRLSVLALLAFPSCAQDDYAQLYRTLDKAPSYEASEIETLDRLGATLVDEGANFGVFSSHASRVELMLFDDPDDSKPTRRFEMATFGEVKNLYVEGIGTGQHYGFIAWGPNWEYDENWLPGRIDGFVADVDADGNRYNPHKLLIDPYARAIHREHEWSMGSIASGPMRTVSTWGAASKAVIVDSQHAWSANEREWQQRRQSGAHSGHAWNDLVVYEVHVKGFTASSASAVDHPGTYRGLGEKADYLADLGITAVELMPVHEKPLDGGYWGYQTLGFFMPERAYAADVRDEQVIDEFKWMVDELHQRGIEVILDVVYNHTGEGGLWREKIAETDNYLDTSTNLQLVNFDPKEVAGLYSFRGLDNQAYYALSRDNQTYWNNTGVGNETRCNALPMRRLIMDSLRYWALEMHVDGFRFDLAPILGQKDPAECADLVADEPAYNACRNSWADPASTVLQDILEDETLRTQHTRMIAEPWSLSGFFLGQFPTTATSSWYEWNGQFRDFWRSFINGDGEWVAPEAWDLNDAVGPVDAGAALTGSQPLFGDDGRRPYHSVNFVTVHDGFTLYDLFSYDTKNNECGPLNPRCCGVERLTAFCDRVSGESHNRSRDWVNEDTKRQLMRNAFVATVLSHGTPMIYGGDEWLRTQLGNNNAYSDGADNPFNWFDWGTWQPTDFRHRMHDFVRQLIRFRKEHAYAFAPAGYDTGAPFAWKTPANTDMQGSDWDGRRVMQHYWDAGRGNELLVMINGDASDATFTLPAGRDWQRRVDTQAFFDTDAFAQGQGAARQSHNIALTPGETLGATYVLKPHSIAVLEAAP
jgi:isoamylase